jgi:hypothetical protein
MLRTLLVLVVASPQILSAQQKAFSVIPREQEIALALSAAPSDVAKNASVYVYGDAGYVRERAGTNGFTCLVNRDSFLDGYEVLKPTCWDALGSETIVPQILFIGKRKAEGANAQTVRAELQQQFADGKFKYPDSGGIAYMLQGDISRYDAMTGKIIDRAFPPHLMLYAPGATQEKLGLTMQAAMHDMRAPLVYSPNNRFSYIVVRVQ